MGLQEDGEIAGELRLQKGQQALTPEQEAEARRFAEERIRAQLDTALVDEGQAEDFCGRPTPQPGWSHHGISTGWMVPWS